MEAEWPAYSGSSQLLWNKLRNVILGAAQFRRAAKLKAARKLSVSTEGGSSLLDHGDRAASRSSLDSHEAVQNDNSLLNRFRKVANIVRGSLNGSEQSVKDVVEQSEEDIPTDNFPTPGSPSECRLLSRSESAGDANIIDKLQQNKKKCSRTLQFNGEFDEGAKQSPGK